MRRDLDMLEIWMERDPRRELEVYSGQLARILERCNGSPEPTPQLVDKLAGEPLDLPEIIHQLDGLTGLRYGACP